MNSLKRGVMFDLNTRKPRSKKWIILAVAVILVAVGVSFFGMRWWQDRQAVKFAATQTQNPQTEEGNASGSDDDASNTAEQNKVLQSSTSPTSNSSVVLPTPILMKSSGNNGSIPSGIEVEFTCTSLPGYSCKVLMSGAHTKTFESKALKDNGRGQAGVSWLWKSESGSHSIVAVLSDSKGNEQKSSAQALEVK